MILYCTAKEADLMNVLKSEHDVALIKCISQMFYGAAFFRPSGNLCKSMIIYDVIIRTVSCILFLRHDRDAVKHQCIKESISQDAVASWHEHVPASKHMLTKYQ